MKLEFKEVINVFFMLFILTYVINCAEDKKEQENGTDGTMHDQDSLMPDIDSSKRKFDETFEEYQTRLAGKYNVKKRTTINYLYDLNGNLMPEGSVSEEISFDNKGRRIEQIVFKTAQQINYKWNFNYDENDNMIESMSYNGFGVMQLKKVLTYNENKKIKTTKEIYPVRGTEINYEFKYDDAGKLIETIATASDGKKSSERRFYNSFAKVEIIEMFGSDGAKTAERKFEYDNKGNLIKERILYPNQNEQATTYSSYDYVYPKEILSPSQKKIYEYNSNGSPNVEIMFNSFGGRQYKFINEYDGRGLITKKTRYDALDKPALIVEYKYEYYK